MSVTSTKRLMRPGTGGSVDYRLNRSYEVVYQVITDNIADGATMVLTAAGLPSLYAPYNADHEYDLGAILTEYSPKRTDDPCIWEVTCKYQSWATLAGKNNPELQNALASLAGTSSGTSSGTGPNPGGFDPQDPISRPPTVRVGFRPYQRVMWADRAGRPIRNSAKERFDPPIEFDDNRPYITITRAERAPLNLTRIVQYQDACNSDVFLGQPVNSAKMRISAERVFEKNLLYWSVTYDIEFRSDLWIPLQVLDAGYTTLPVNTKAPGPRILGTDNNPCPAPVPLYTVTGAEFPAIAGTSTGDVIQLPVGYSTQYLSFNLYNSLPYSVFGLNVNF